MQVTSDPAQRFRASLALLRTRRFGTFWIASLLSNIGYWAQEVAQPWLLLNLGASPFLVGFDAFVGDAPAWLLTLVGGVLADRADRRKVIAGFQLIQMLCPIALVVLLVTGTVRPWFVIATSLIVGVTDALSMPSFQTIVPTIVEPDQIGTGLALSSTQFNLSRILGPATAGALMAGVGAIGCFVVNAASYIPFILVALWILPRRSSQPAFSPKRDRARPFEGMREIVRAPHVRGALAVVSVLTLLCTPLITFCPVLVRDAFHGDAGRFSLAIAAFGVGGLLGGLALLGIDTTRDQRRLCSRLATGVGVVVILAALAPWYWALPGLALLAGLGMTMTNTLINTLLQSTAGPGLRGQTISTFMLAMRGGMALGSLLGGISVHVLGVRTALAINGSIAVAVQLALGQVWPRSPLPAPAPQGGTPHEPRSVTRARETAGDLSSPMRP